MITVCVDCLLTTLKVVWIKSLYCMVMTSSSSCDLINFINDMFLEWYYHIWHYRFFCVATVWWNKDEYIYRPRSDIRLSWPGLSTYSGRFTRIKGHPSATGRAQNSESSPAKDRRSTTVSRNQPWCVSDFRFTHGEWWKLIEELRVRGVTQEVRLIRGLNRRTRDSP